MMSKYTQKQLRALVASGQAEDVTRIDNDEYWQLKLKEGLLDQVGYSSGVYGLNGALLQGYNTGTLYAVTARTTALFILC